MPPLTVDRALGQGGMGTVYLAHDSSGIPFAVKVLKNGSEELLRMFESEAGILAKLRHPRLVAIEGFSRSGDVTGLPPSPCFWMEYVEGRPLLEASADAGSDQILQWLEEGLEALHYLHHQGLLHGDLKPANLLVDRQGHLKLVDFGLASLTSRLSAPQGARPGGSLPYLAPEAVEGRRSPASDLFSLGTVFYQALSGTHPRQGAKNLSQLFAADFPSLSKKIPDLPRRPARVIERMIEADAERRLQSAGDALAALGGEERPGDEGSEESFHSFEMFGAEEGREAFRRFLAERLEKNTGGLVLVHGMSGVGKTRWMREAAIEMGLAGLSPSGSRLIHHAETLKPEQIGEIFRLLQEESSARVLVLEYHEERLSPELAALFASLTARPDTLDIRLSHLDFADTGRFLKQALKAEVPGKLVEEIFSRTQGNPRLLTETCRDLRSSGLLDRKHLNAEALSQIQIPQGFEEIFQARLRKIDPPLRRLIETLTLSAEGATPAELAELAASSVRELQPSLETLMTLGLIKLKDREGLEAYQLAHAALVDPILSGLKSERREQGHRDWIALLERRRPQAFAALAAHAMELPKHPRAVEWALKASEELFKGERFTEAIALAERGLPLATEKTARDALLRLLANAYGRQGHFSDSIQYIERWHREGHEDPLGNNEVKFWLASGLSHKNLGNLEEARRRFENCIAGGDSAQEPQRDFLARAHSLLGQLDIEAGDDDSAESHFGEALQLLPRPGVQRAEVLKHQAQLLAKRGRWSEALNLLDLAGKMYEEAGDHQGRFSVALERGNLALDQGRLDETEAAYQEAQAIASAKRDENSLARVYQNLGVLQSRRGDYPSALDYLARAQEIFVFFGSGFERAMNFLQLALAHGAVGNFAEAESFWRSAQSQGESSPEYERRRKQISAWLSRLKPESWIAEAVEAKAEVPDWDLEGRLFGLLDGEGNGETDEIRRLLLQIQARLPDPLKIRFEERADYRHYVLQENSTPSSKESPPMDLLQKLAAITAELLRSNRLDDVLVKLMDTAMELSKAERGFLVVRSENKEGPLPGYEIKVARNLARELIEKEDSSLSLSAVREAVQSGSPVLTDNALQDERFETAESVHALELKSILVLPLKATQGVIGALYLDHRYQTNLFKPGDLVALQAFADQAALALQKAQMIEELKRANDRLAQTVDDQATELSVLKREVEDQRQKLTFEYKDIVGTSPAMLEVLSLVDRITETAVPVWIYGESGTGKEMIARALHFNSSRAKKPFVSENCSALPETLLESELFGHKRGAFTHADRDKKGLLEYANGGTIFLDEIADMSPTMQAKLLRFLQEGEIRPLGSNETIKVKVRVVSASNKDLLAMIGEGKFREDLYYRLNGVTVSLPPLRERLEDIPILARHFLKKFAKDEDQTPLEITPEALEMMMAHSWPGNVRELENTLRTAALFHQKHKLTPKSFNFKKVFFEGKPEAPAGAPSGAARKTAPAAASNLSDEKRILLKALYDQGYHKGLAAEALGISRRYLYTQMMRHGVPINRIEMKSYVESQLGLK
ncbi:MAG TPA: sigma 54-interacting transcriptional regulator [bacterium]|nr:sigma 54-interacting transcriptional regulator [bacterium]